MIKSKYASSLDNFICHGTKDLNGYTYILLIDGTGLTICQRITDDNTEVLFTLKSETETIPDFWADITGKTFKYFFQL